MLAVSKAMVVLTSLAIQHRIDLVVLMQIQMAGLTQTMISRTNKHNIPILMAMDLETQSTDSKQITVLLMQEHPQKIDSAVSTRIQMAGLT